jgi:hypothetical protein
MQTSSPLRSSPLRRALRRAPALLTALLLGVAASGPGLTSAQAATPNPAITPTTTYVPSGGTAVPGAATPATPGTAATTTPAVGIPATPSVQTAAPAPTTAPAQTPAAGTAKAGKTSKGDRPLSTGAIVIAALAALLLLTILGWALARRRAFEPHWLLALRHAMAEAGFRASATWSEFADWARLGH